MDTTLTAIEALALSKAVKAERDAVEVGEHHVDVTVRITGTLSVAKDTEKTPTVSIPLKEVLALFIARSGCTREASIALLRECMTEALADGTKGVGAVDAAADIDACWKDEVSKLTASLPKTPVKGAVKAKLSVAVVADDLALAAK